MKKNIKKIILISLLLFILIYSIINFSKQDSFFVDNNYLQNGFSLTKCKNIVTAIYLDYRLYDTFGEVMLLLTAAIGVKLLLNRR
ncbi:MAG: hypothetical protein DRH57_02085 [Candidatus Cloacimonadota bacterium]|nr:MAG: hypothetical protein DRH57_02085 [Candidatus Cloacimonadota bacterium]